MPPNRIIIADDEHSIIVPVQFLLEQNKFNVRTVDRGDAVMDAVLSFRPDLILLDIMLPVMDGFEICQRIREHPDLKQTKIIFLSAVARDVDISKGMALGADGYITKPFSNVTLLDHIRKVLAG
ncbi:MAG: response regulator [Desulfobacteraceae bacterium]|nr:response regulator [Desulfobacteraceae bacterium]